MDAGSGVGAETPALSLTLWRVTYLSLPYVLDTIALSRAGGDLVDDLLLAAIVQANVAPLNQEAALQLAYATLDAVAPDELRRPVSVNALAESLGLPFETVRRRVGRLARNGSCVITPRGALISEAALATPEYKALVLARYQRLRRFYSDLLAAEALPEIATGTEFSQVHAPPAAGPPVRAVDRLLGDFMMRFADSVMRRLGDAVTGMVLFDMGRANTEHLTRAELEAAIPVADDRRRPVTLARLAQRLDIPVETVRRRTAFLEREGFCRRTGRGFVIMSASLARPGVASLIVENAASVQRLFTRLDRLGILALWDAEALADEIGGAAAGS